MGAAIKGGIGLAVVVEILTIVWIMVGLHENPLMGLVFVAIAIVLDLIAVFWALKQTASVNGYGKQLLSGLVVGIVGGVLIFLLSLTNYSVLFPNAIEEQKAGAAEFIENSGLPEEAKAARIEQLEAGSAVSNATSALVGTVAFGAIWGAILGAFMRKK